MIRATVVSSLPNTLHVRPFWRVTALLLVLCGAALFAPAIGRAATITPTIFGDFGTGGCDAASCSLREAITEANASAGADVIVLSGGTYTLSIAGTAENANANGDLDVAADGTGGALTITGATGAARSVIANAGGAERLLEVHSNNLFVMSDVTLQGGTSPDTGGGLHLETSVSTITRSRFTGNTAGSAGGGVYVEGGTLTISDSRIDANQSHDRGAGMFMDTNGTITLNRMDIYNNHTLDANSNAGGVFIDGMASGTINDSTIANNTSTLNGGGVYLNTNGHVTLRNDTIVGNVADSDHTGSGLGGGIYADGGNGTVNIGNSILAGNIQKRASTTGVAENCNNDQGTVTWTTVGRNLVDNTTNCTIWQASDMTGVSPGLGSYGAHGGLTSSFLLSAGSLAIDKGDAATCAGRPFDQRGFQRTIGATCDIGSTETGAKADLAVTGASKLTLHLHKTTTTRLKVSNKGFDLARGAKVVIKLPAGYKGKASGGGLSCSGSKTITCKITGAGLAVGVTRTIKLKITEIRHRSGTLSATSSHLGSDPVAANNLRKIKLKGRG